MPTEKRLLTVANLSVGFTSKAELKKKLGRAGMRTSNTGPDNQRHRLIAITGVLCGALLVSATAVQAAGSKGTPPTELADVTGYEEVGNGGVGPDVVGFRINMTPLEVVKVIEQHPGLPYSHSFESTLAFQSVDFKQMAVEGGDFINFITAFNLEAGRMGVGPSLETKEVVTLAFTIVPKRGRVYGMTRQLLFPQGKEPAKASVAQSLVEKYGVPLLLGDSIMMWSYDSQAQLLKTPAPGTQAANEQLRCIGYHVDSLTPSPLAVSTVANDGQMHWNITQPANPALRYQSGSPYSRLNGAKVWESACGAIVVRATLQATGPLIHGLEVRIASPDMVPPAQKQAMVLIEAARKADEAKKVGDAQKNTPPL
jgi:hypothetical protein